MLPERSTMNTASGFALFGRSNFGTRVTMRAFELGGHLTECGEGMLCVGGVVWGVRGVSTRYTEIGWDSDWERGRLSDMYARRKIQWWTYLHGLDAARHGDLH